MKHGFGRTTLILWLLTAGVVSVAITDAIDLQKTYVHYNCGIRYGHDSARTDLKMSKMVWIDFRQWDN